MTRSHLKSCSVLALLLMSLMPMGVRGQSADARELQVKSELLLRFAHYVRWPAAAAAAGSGELVICFVSGHPIGTALDRLVGREVQGYTVRVRSADTPQGVEACNIFFSGDGADARVPAMLDRARALPVLTVGEGAGFASGKGIIGLVRDETRLGFEVNVEASRRVGLQVSSRLLALATVVE